MTAAQPEQGDAHQAPNADHAQAQQEPAAQPRGARAARRRGQRALWTWLRTRRRRPPRADRHGRSGGTGARSGAGERGTAEGGPLGGQLPFDDARRAYRDRLIQEARKQGNRAGRSGQFDAWSFGGDPVPYLRYLEHDRKRAIAESIILAGQSQDEAMHRHWSAVAEAKVTDRRAEDLRRRRTEAEQQMQVLHGQVDRLAIWEAWRRERRKDPTWALTPPATVPGQGAGSEGGAEQVEAGRFAVGARWEGAYTPRMSQRSKWGIIAALGLVEIPIQFQIFQFFHDNNWHGLAMTILFTVSVSLLMVLLPHVAGRWYRTRHATGADTLSRFVPLTLMVPWAFVAYVLGDLRRKILLAPTVIEGERVSQFNAVEILNLSPVTISVMFISLLVLTGGISFLLGLAHDHPLQAGYQAARDERDRIGRELDDVERAAHAAMAEVEAYPDRWVGQRVLWDEETRVLRETYDGAAAMYLDAIAEAVADPAVTEALTSKDSTGRSDAPEEDRHDRSDPQRPGRARP